jgi:hypothetical protein
MEARSTKVVTPGVPASAGMWERARVNSRILIGRASHIIVDMS